MIWPICMNSFFFDWVVSEIYNLSAKFGKCSCQGFLDQDTFREHEEEQE